MTPRYPAKPRPGDRIAIVSPSAGLPALFPLPYELGLRRLREEFGLEPVEYPTTRAAGASPEARAADLHAAFADPTIAAVMASIGGDDQITVLRHLDRDLLRANPKPFFGFSDNTNLLLALHNAGVVAYHGASVMTELGRPGAPHPLTVDSLRAALFSHGPYELVPAAAYRDVDLPWEDPESFAGEPETVPGGGWSWYRADRVVEGPGWGGNIEVLSWLLMADREILPPDAYTGRVLFLETSEEMPEAEEVYRILRGMGERGLLERFGALLMGRAKSWSFARPLDREAGALYRAEQRAAVLRALDAYAPELTVVFDVDFGHTDPQLVLPVGGAIRVDGPARRITVTY
ncbi:S66 peptidase family protein [Streptomyces sp. BPTC-684]|uniref:S66 family peptidase n=1 Tax=Streptomyces sp. BPTC-684 TaxID=3043734 RepID=UPI0024B16F73|nr:S66 peptidase family protein [Streptomyces sp. BPTC-684]WHM41314.1 LD-carboxypeptidase [Streptomyces sp. BPTC-684]